MEFQPMVNKDIIWSYTKDLLNDNAVKYYSGGAQDSLAWCKRVK